MGRAEVDRRAPAACRARGARPGRAEQAPLEESWCHRLAAPRPGDPERRRVIGLDDEVDPSACAASAERSARGLDGQRAHARRRPVEVWRHCSRAERIDEHRAVRLREVHVLPRGEDPPDHREVRSHLLPGPDERVDVPVAEGDVTGGVDDHDVGVEGIERHRAVDRRVHLCPVRARDVDAEVEAALGAEDAWIAERPTDRVLAVEGLHGPAVRRGRPCRGGGGRRCREMRHAESRGEREGAEHQLPSRPSGVEDRGSGGHDPTVELPGNRPTTTRKRRANAAGEHADASPGVVVHSGCGHPSPRTP